MPRENCENIGSAYGRSARRLVMAGNAMGKGQTLLNLAWRKFRSGPVNYPIWEKAAMDEYFKPFGL